MQRTANVVYVADKRLLCGPSLTQTFQVSLIAGSVWIKPKWKQCLTSKRYFIRTNYCIGEYTNRLTNKRVSLAGRLFLFTPASLSRYSKKNYETERT